MTREITLVLHEYWPHVVLVLSVLASLAAAVHAAMTKQDVRAAIGWVAVVIFSPLLGATFYLFAGINRVRRARVSQRRESTEYELEVMERLVAQDLSPYCESYFDALKRVGDRITRNRLLLGNRIELLSGGDETYPAMLQAIASAKRSIALQSYIFDRDGIGLQIAQALIDAQSRGVQVRVLIDAVGAKYSRPTIVSVLSKGKVPVGRFLPTAIGLRLVYANLRSHRKVLVIDGERALAGGMNIRAGFMQQFAGPELAHDTHFRIEGPVVRQLMDSFAHDWEFTTQEHLRGPAWFVPVLEAQSAATPIRVVPSGPDRTLGSNQGMLLGALSVARAHVRIQSPYFLPDNVLIGALVTAARRGVVVDIVIPGHNNLRLVGAAMEAQLELMVQDGVRVWRSGGAFDHSKLMTIDGQWSYVGSSNLDPRSLRLNFELDLEVYSKELAGALEKRIDQAIASGHLVTWRELKAKPFWLRLRNRLIWLVSPYL
jgi:cardiolipin synthase